MDTYLVVVRLLVFFISGLSLPRSEKNESKRYYSQKNLSVGASCTEFIRSKGVFNSWPKIGRFINIPLLHTEYRVWEGVLCGLCVVLHPNTKCAHSFDSRESVYMFLECFCSLAFPVRVKWWHLFCMFLASFCPSAAYTFLWRTFDPCLLLCLHRKHVLSIIALWKNVLVIFRLSLSFFQMYSFFLLVDTSAFFLLFFSYIACSILLASSSRRHLRIGTRAFHFLRSIRKVWAISS